eukprot:804591-Pelagomonas_calceolata.AAC.3
METFLWIPQLTQPSKQLDSHAVSSSSLLSTHNTLQERFLPIPAVCTVIREHGSHSSFQATVSNGQLTERGSKWEMIGVMETLLKVQLL